MENTSTTPNKRLLNTFRVLALIEGISLIVLLVFSVLKRGTLAPDLGALGVTWVGRIHGALVVVFIYLLVLCANRYSWSFGRALRYFVASLIPFAPFLVDRELKKEAEQA